MLIHHSNQMPRDGLHIFIQPTGRGPWRHSHQTKRGGYDIHMTVASGSMENEGAAQQEDTYNALYAQPEPTLKAGVYPLQFHPGLTLG